MTVRRRASKHGRATVVAVVAGLLVAAVPASARPGVAAAPAVPAQEAHDDHGADGNHGLQKEYDAVLAEEQQLVDDLDRLAAERERIDAELARLTVELEQARHDLVGAHMALTAAEEAEQKSREERLAAELEVVITRQRMQDQAVATFVRGGDDEDLMSAILAAESVSDAATALTYSRTIIGDTDQLLDDYEAARLRRIEAQDAAEAARAAAIARRDEIATLTRSVADSVDEQQALGSALDATRLEEALKLEEVRSRKAKIETQITAMTHASDGVQQLLAAVQAEQPDWDPGEIVVTTPLPGYRIGSKFGMRHHPILGISRLHAGGDMGAPSGTPIHAPADGTVVFAGPRGGYGNTVVIDHGYSLGTLHAHQTSIEVATGDEVRRGEIIGYVGSTGLSTGPHLHFETRLRGVPVDPETVVDWDVEVDYEELVAGYEDEDRAAAERRGG